MKKANTRLGKRWEVKADQRGEGDVNSLRVHYMQFWKNE